MVLIMASTYQKTNKNLETTEEKEERGGNREDSLNYKSAENWFGLISFNYSWACIFKQPRNFSSIFLKTIYPLSSLLNETNETEYRTFWCGSWYILCFASKCFSFS